MPDSRSWTLQGALALSAERGRGTPGTRPGARDDAAKRVFDMLAAGTGLLLLLPLLLLIAAAIRLDSPGPVLFRQRRTGRHEKPFAILKFRSMRVLEDGERIVQAVEGDARISRVGRTLRKTGLDELPQLLNVLRGEMSLVGPRPHALAHDVHYGAQVAGYRQRFQVRPGITGWAQIHGACGPTPALEHMQRRIDLDLWYIANRSLWRDVTILLRTPLAMLRQHRLV